MSSPEPISDDIEQARDRMQAVAQKLAMKIGPSHAADVLIGAGAAILESVFGAETAAEYFRHLADSIERDDDDVPPAPVVGHG